MFAIYTSLWSILGLSSDSLSVGFFGTWSLDGLVSSVSLDSPEAWQLSFQDSASVAFEGIQELHNSALFFVVAIVVATVYMLFAICLRFSAGRPSAAKYLNHGTLLELVWTVSPAFILIAIAFPSFRLLYLMDEVIAPSLTVKVLGHQWYWSYEYSDSEIGDNDGVVFDSYMVDSASLEDGALRLLEVDNAVAIPLDAIPGRLNQTSTLAERPGSFYGQCSELCGVYHGFMPIVVNVLSPSEYMAWLLAQE
ncbi:cytochrome c oxidase subunit 2 [Phaffia rhodozyma]|uniref:Cytochrome c oxidase subunit 2 n=1 Tax=Phaffia rhodozyma TaxID=264483 RepID=A0A0F7SGI5_PHARH|nr:cytochrome c oxidase subunit 2 [Phaffia rhodozyma]